MAETTMEPAVPPFANPGGEELEQRLQRLEDVVAGLCDTQVLEDRVRERVLEQLRAEIETLKGQKAAKPAAEEFTDGESSPKPLPRSEPPLAALAAASRPVPPPPEPTRSLFREVAWETRTLFQMVRDPFYRMSWAAKLVLLLPMGYMLWSLIVGFPAKIPLIGYVLDFVIISVIAYVVYKVFGRELRRYREFTTRNPW